jgi:DNA-binding phage protein
MENIKNVFETLNKKQTYSEIAVLAGVSRNTIRNVRNEPEKARLKTLRKIFKAMGYELVLTLEKIKEVS